MTSQRYSDLALWGLESWVTTKQKAVVLPSLITYPAVSQAFKILFNNLDSQMQTLVFTLSVRVHCIWRTMGEIILICMLDQKALKVHFGVKY